MLTASAGAAWQGIGGQVIFGCSPACLSHTCTRLSYTCVQCLDGHLCVFSILGKVYLEVRLGALCLLVLPSAPRACVWIGSLWCASRLLASSSVPRACVDWYLMVRLALARCVPCASRMFSLWLVRIAQMEWGSHGLSLCASRSLVALCASRRGFGRPRVSIPRAHQRFEP